MGRSLCRPIAGLLAGPQERCADSLERAVYGELSALAESNHAEVAS